MRFTIKDKQLFLDEEPLDLDGIQVLEDLSHGPKAHVFKVYNTTTGRHEALKVMAHEKEDYFTEAERIRQELEQGADLQTDGIASVYSTGTVNDQYYGLMEYIDGISLQKYLQSDPDFSSRCNYLVQILQALKEIYTRGEFHSDILSDNIMIDEKNQKAFLIDFGSSRFSSAKKASDKNSKLLLGLCIETLPELNSCPLILKGLAKKAPLFIIVIMEMLISLVKDIELRRPNAWDQYSLIQYIVLPVDSIKAQYKKGSLQLEQSKVFKFFDHLKLPKEKIKILKSWYIKISGTPSQ